MGSRSTTRYFPRQETSAHPVDGYRARPQPYNLRWRWLHAVHLGLVYSGFIGVFAYHFRCSVSH